MHEVHSLTILRTSALAVNLNVSLSKLTASTINNELISATIWLWLHHRFRSSGRRLMLGCATTYNAKNKSCSNQSHQGFV